MDKYVYDGPVMEFDRLVASHWKGETYAKSPAKAKSNLAYQFKKISNRPAMAKITLPSEVRKVS